MPGHYGKSMPKGKMTPAMKKKLALKKLKEANKKKGIKSRR